MQIRKAKLKDLDQLVILTCELQQMHVNWDSFRFSKISDFRKFIKKDIKAGIYSNKRCVLVVIDDKNKMIGFIEGEIKNKGQVICPYVVGHIRNIYIEPKHRTKGTGKELIEKINEWFKKNKAKEMSLSVYCQNDKAISFYKKIGFKDFTTRMVKKL